MDDLARAQESLGRALGRARVGEDRELANKVRELGERLAHLLAGLLKMSRMHSPDNQAFDNPVKDLEATIVQLHELLGTIHLVVVEDQVYVNDVRIRGGERASGMQELGAELARHNVGGVTIHTPLDGPRIRGLVKALGAPAVDESPRRALEQALKTHGLEGIDLQGRFRFRMAGERTQQKQEARETLERLVDSVEEAHHNLAAGRVPNPLPLRRMVSELIQSDLHDERLWVDPPEASSWALHCFRVCHLSLLMGEALALPEAVLQDLGVAALYHDAGYADAKVHGAPAQAGLAAHPVAGARLMLRQKGFHEAKIRRILALLDHHRDATASESRPGLLARILRVAEDYDNLARRSGSTSPTMALAMMLKWSGTRYDSDILQLLINVLGAYPPGTLLQTEQGHIARSVAPSQAPDGFAAPKVRCLRLPDGKPAPADAPPLDLRNAGRIRVLRPSPPRSAG
jgi:hypothetical protein